MESLVGDKRRKEDKKVLRIYFANKINIKNAPKYVIISAFYLVVSEILCTFASDKNKKINKNNNRLCQIAK